MAEPIQLRVGDALVIVDVQNDFLPGGALGVRQGDEVVPVLNSYIERFARRNFPVFATRDWHPANHCSFNTVEGPWPKHCVMYTNGADFAPRLKLPPNAIIISKGTRADREAYSGFEKTDFEEQLRAAGAQRLFVGGLATDYCVLSTVRDAREKGFAVFLLRDAIRGVDLKPGDGERAVEEMQKLGAISIELSHLAQ